MAVVSIASLKAKWVTGYIPTELDYDDVWDTMFSRQSYQLIGSITAADVNANVGSNSFSKGSFSYNGKAIVSISCKITELFDVDTIESVGVKDITNSTAETATMGTSLNDLSIKGVITLTQTNAGNYSIFVSNFGAFSGGNTTGNINVYGLFADLP